MWKEDLIFSDLVAAVVSRDSPEQYKQLTQNNEIHVEELNIIINTQKEKIRHNITIKKRLHK